MPALDRSVRYLSALVTPLLLAALAGCAAAASVTPRATSPATTATVVATATPDPLPALPAAQVSSGACGAYAPQSGAVYTPARGLVVTQTSSLGNLAYPDVQIPSSQQAQPIPQPSLSDTNGYTPGATPGVNPKLAEKGGGYVLFICNPAGQAHTLNAVQASIARITPFTDQLQAWQPCSGAYYLSGAAGGGCGGADFEDEYLHAPFAADAQVGDSVTTTQMGINYAGNPSEPGEVARGPLPVTLHPGQWMTVEIGVTQPSAPGYYTYAFALTVDGVNTGVVAYSQTSLLAPVAHRWTGANCQTPAMQAQIAQEPTPTANGGFICP